jgi:sec-independent protein translocase protein TatA
MPIGMRELLIILLIAIVLFGAKKLPDLARSIGRSARILKAETKGLREEDEEQKGRPADAQQPQQAQAQQQPAPQAQQPYGQQPYDAQPGYPELPPGQRVVNENGETVRRSHGG